MLFSYESYWRKIIMKLYEKYKLLKEINETKRYLFKSGNFYIFLSDDASYISSVTTLKITDFGNTIKCGFPLQSLDKYLKIFDNIGIDIKVIEIKDDIVKEISSIDLDLLSKSELIYIIERFIDCI